MASLNKTPQTYEETHVTNVYNQIAMHFKNTRSYSWSWITEFVHSFPKTSLLYDIGCGSGRNMNYKDYNFIGVDNCDEFLSICRSNGQQVVKASMTNIPLHDKSCDGIMCIAAFHHLSTPERRVQALQEMKRLLKDDGRILLSVWSIKQPEKTRRKFTKYGDTMVPWKNHDGTHHDRYYYIFKICELYHLFETVHLRIVKHTWEVGNEVFMLAKC